jgi:trk system potassium uptake protein TrkH
MWATARRADLSRMGTKEALASVAMSWIGASAVGALPYWFGGEAATYADAFFEGMSGFTTTGATILRTLDDLPRGLLLWRGMTHWLGGMGIIGLALVMMPMSGGGGFHLYSAEAPGMIHEKITPRLRQTVAALWLAYLSLTLILAAILAAMGMNFFDAVSHSMATISTGGFSTRDAGVAFFRNPSYEWVLIVFMFISGMNFTLFLNSIRGRSIAGVFSDPEFRFYFLTVSSLSVLAAAGLYLGGALNLPDAVRHGAFQVTSFITTTGFVSADYSEWPYAARAILMICAFLGGCAGSTAGGIKQVRLLVMFHILTRRLAMVTNPRLVISPRLGNRTLDTSAVSSCMAFFGLYVIVFAAGAFALTLFEPDLLTALTGAAAALGNVGPGFGKIGYGGNFSGQALGAKWVYSFLMLCGRLELYTVLILFTRAYWREGIIISDRQASSGGRKNCA